MVNELLKHDNAESDGSKYAADFDYIMHQFCVEKFSSFIVGCDVVELGCYHGHMTNVLSKQAKSVIAVDIDEECLRRTHGNLDTTENVTLVHAAFDDLSLEKEVDTVYFSHALEHVANPQKTLEKIRAAVNAKRYIVIVPNGESLSRRIAQKLGLVQGRLTVTEFERNIGHHTTFNRGALEYVATNAGFNVVESGGICPKIFSNGQIDRALKEGIITLDFLHALNQLSEELPDICASTYVIAE